MDFEYTPEQEAFRVEVRAWLSANFPSELAIDDPMDERIAPNQARSSKSGARGRRSSRTRDGSGSPGPRNTVDAGRR